jgi:hypothetical protein
MQIPIIDDFGYNSLWSISTLNDGAHVLSTARLERHVRAATGYYFDDESVRVDIFRSGLANDFAAHALNLQVKILIEREADVDSEEFAALIEMLEIRLRRIGLR